MNFISNAPLGEDLFEGKSQELIANAIVEQLKNNADQNHRSMQQKMIGVEGEWGSGKSNLIEIVKKKLEKEKHFLFFTYDVWGHQEDLQRKAILNELVDFLIQKKAVENNDKKNDNNNWRERVKKATGTVTEATHLHIPNVSWGVFFCALILLIIPFCNQIAELESIKSINLFFFPLSVIIVLIPLILLVPLYVIFLNSICKEEKRFLPSKKMLLDAVAKILSVYKDNDTESTNRDYVNELNPSVMDFRALLKALSESLKDKHLVVFFDNMDRLTKEKVENLWSSIHTFFAEKHGYRNISCIISFDRNHIRAAFPIEEIEKAFNKNNSKGDDYIDKTFDIVFRVAPPVLSDWKKFFEIKWKDAFGEDFDLNEYDFVIQAYDILSDKNALTPRAIIRFINECVLQKKISAVPERYIAVFNLRKKDLILNPLDKSCLGNLLPIYENDLKYDDCIAALVYQVPPDKAKSVIYAASLRRALEQGNQEDLTKIAKTPFFEDVLEDALNTIGSLKDAIISLDKMEQIPLAEMRQRKLWEDLLSRANKLMQFDSGKIEPFQLALLRHLDDKKKNNLAKKVLSPYNDVDFTKTRDVYETTGKEHRPEEYVDLLKKLESCISSDKLKDFIPKLQIEPDAYISLLKKYDNIGWIAFKCNDLGRYISNLPYEQIIELGCLDKLPRSIKQYLNISDGLKVLFSEKDKIYNDDVFKIVIKIVSSAPKSRIEPNWLDWDAMERRLKDECLPEIKGALLAFRLMFYNHPLQNGNIFDHLLKEEELSSEERKKLFEFLLARRNFAQLIIDEYLLKNYPIVTKFLKECIAKDSLEIDYEDTINLLPELDVVNRYFDIDYLYSKMANAYIANKEKFNKITEFRMSRYLDDFWPEEILPYESLVFIVKKKEALSKKLIGLLKEYFDSLNKNEWIKRLRDVNAYGVKEALLIKYNWSQNAKDAINFCLNECMGSQSTSLNNSSHSFNHNVWNEIINSLDKKIRRNLFEEMRDNLCHGFKMNTDLFIAVGNWLLKYGNIYRVKGEILRSIVPALLLENIEATKIIANNFGVIKNALNKEKEAKEWIAKAKMLSKTRDNYPLKEYVKSL